MYFNFLKLIIKINNLVDFLKFYYFTSATLSFFKNLQNFRVIHEITFIPQNYSIGSLEKGEAFLNGYFIIENNNGIVRKFSWESVEKLFSNEITNSNNVKQYIHSFVWLTNLKQLSDISSRRLAKRTIEYWISSEKKMKKFSKKNSFKAYIISQRISSWLLHYDFFNSCINDEWREKFFLSITKQYFSLKKMLKENDQNFFKIISIKGLMDYNMLVRFDEKFFFYITKVFFKIFNFEINHDGSLKLHDSAKQLMIFEMLCHLRGTLNQFSKTEIAFRNNNLKKFITESILKINNLIELMIPVIRFLRHINGELCLLHNKFLDKYYSTSEALINRNIFTRIYRSEEIDAILSNVYITSKNIPKELTSAKVLRLTKKKCSIFINLKNSPPDKTTFNDFGINYAEDVFDFEINYDSNQFIKNSKIWLYSNKINENHLIKNYSMKEYNTKTFHDSSSENDYAHFFGKFTRENNKKTDYGFSREIYISPEKSITGEEKIIINSEVCKSVCALFFRFPEESYSLEKIEVQKENGCMILIKKKIKKKSQTGIVRWSFIADSSSEKLSVELPITKYYCGILIFCEVKEDFENVIRWKFSKET